MKKAWASALGRVAAVVAALLFLGAALVCGAAGHVALAVVPGLIGTGFGAAGVAARRVARLGWALALGVGVAFLAFRTATVRAPEGWQVCQNEACSRGGPWWSRVLPEQASADAGFRLATWLGIVRPEEGAAYAREFGAEFDRLPDGPNAALLFSTPAQLRRFVVEPPGEGPLPAVVFLHGFGGPSSSYVSVMARALAGRAVLVAPALDVGARWDSARGTAVVEATLRTLPPRVDRRRVVLVGLSNGSIFGAVHAHRFAGAVLVSGIGEARRGPVVAVSGGRDLRVPLEAVREGVVQLQRSGVEASLVEVPQADHGLLLTHPEAWVGPVLKLLK